MEKMPRWADAVLVPLISLMLADTGSATAPEFPDVRHVILDGIGHMTAIEDPERTIKEILDFLETVKKTGKAG